jgi:hypothetical protein
MDHLTQHGGIEEIITFANLRGRDRNVLYRLVSEIVRSRRTDVIPAFIAEFGPSVKAFFGEGTFGEYDATEEAYERTRVMLRLLHSQGINFERYLAHARRWLAEYIPSPYGMKKEALENIIQTLEECGY